MLSWTGTSGFSSSVWISCGEMFLQCCAWYHLEGLLTAALILAGLEWDGTNISRKFSADGDAPSQENLGCNGFPVLT